MVVANSNSAHTTHRTHPRRCGCGEGTVTESSTTEGADMSRHRPSEPLPHLAVRELVRIERVRLHGDAVAGARGDDVSRVANDTWIYEMLMQMIDVFAHAILEPAADGDVV